MRALCLALTLLPLPLLADPVLPGKLLNASEFEAYATGKTLTYAQDGTIWGSEQYMSGRRVLWAFTGQACEYGQWHAEQDAICFVYEGKTDPNCWHFYLGATGLVAQFLGEDSTTQLSEVDQSTEPMNCPGPEVGV